MKTVLVVLAFLLPAACRSPDSQPLEPKRPAAPPTDAGPVPGPGEPKTDPGQPIGPLAEHDSAHPPSDAGAPDAGDDAGPVR